MQEKENKKIENEAIKLSENLSNTNKEYLTNIRKLNSENTGLKNGYEFNSSSQEKENCLVSICENIKQYLFHNGHKQFKKDCKSEGFAWYNDNYKTNEAVYITEGIFDCLVLQQANFNAVAAYSATNMPTKFYSTLAKDSEIILAFDDDTTGKEAIEKNYRYLTQQGFNNISVMLPIRKHKDWNDMHKAGLKLSSDIDLITECQSKGSRFIEEINSWGDIEFEYTPEPLPEFPIDSLPDIIKKTALEISNKVKAAPEMIIIELLTAFSSCTGNMIKTQIGTVVTDPHDYAICFVERGERKSTTFKPIQKPIYDWITKRTEIYNDSMFTYSTDEARLKKLKENYCSCKDDEKRKKIKWDMEELKRHLKHSKPVNPYFLASDVTTGAALDILAETNGKIALFSDDARDQLQQFLGIYTGGQTQEHLWTKVYSRNAPLEHHRRGAGKIIIKNPVADILLLTQTDMIQQMLKTESFSFSGLNSRVTYVFPNSLVGKKDCEGNLIRAFDKRGLDKAVMLDYEAIIISLLDKYYFSEDEKIFELTPDAKEAWIKFYNEIESQSGRTEQFADYLDFSVRLPEKALKYALLFSIIANSESITKQDIEAGINIALYYFDHAKRLVDYTEATHIPKEALKILRQIQAGKHLGNKFSLREACQYCNLSKNKAMEAMQYIETKNIIRLLPTVQEAGKKAPSPTYEVNPEFYNIKRAF